VIVLDTHAWLWWVSAPEELGRRARRELARARDVGIPAICCLEVATLVARRRIELDRPILDWLDDALAEPKVELLPISPAIAVKAATLGDGFQGDPADRLIVATAVLHSATLLTKDQRTRVFRACGTDGRVA
jgi:PIN domain nuclease of toxin-antitoxin system